MLEVVVFMQLLLIFIFAIATLSNSNNILLSLVVSIISFLSIALVVLSYEESHHIVIETKEVVADCEYDIPRNQTCELIMYAKPTNKVYE